MAKAKFDPNAAFRNIVGIPEEDEKMDETEIMPSNADKEIKLPSVIAKNREERRNKSIHLLIKPSTHTKAQRKCKQIGVSLNECINQLIENWINE